MFLDDFVVAKLKPHIRWLVRHVKSVFNGHTRNVAEEPTNGIQSLPIVIYSYVVFCIYVDYILY